MIPKPFREEPLPLPKPSVPVHLESVLGVGNPIHSSFPEIGPPSDPKPLEHKEILAMGLFCLFLIDLFDNKKVKWV